MSAPGLSDPGADDLAVADDEWWIPPCDGVPPTDEERAARWHSDPWSGPPDGPDEWLARLSSPELEAISDAMPPPVSDALPAGFWHRDDSGGGPGFVAGGSLDVLPPGAVLAGFVETALLAGLRELSDDEVVGFMRAGRRLSSWAAAAELTAVTELDRRRLAAKARRSSVDSEHVSEELAAALTLTSWTADSLLDLARRLSCIPAVMTALADGSIDLPRAVVFTRQLSAVADSDAVAIVAAVLPQAGQLTTGQLSVLLRRMVIALDPDAARRRAEQGRAEARVEIWEESSGNAGLTGRELSRAEVIAADQRIGAIARALKAAGVPGTMDQLRARVFTALLAGRDPDTLLPDSGQATASGASVAFAAAGAGSGRARESMLAQLQDANRIRPASNRDPAAMSWLGNMTGSVTLIVPIDAWASLSDAPGEAAGYGPLDAETCRFLGNTLARNGRTRWCLTVTDASGRALGHGCARPGPGPGPPGAAGLAAWARSLPLAWLEHAPCTHQRETHGYRPGAVLRHLIKVRHRTCAFPGCRRLAGSCDDDHTVPFDQGGTTCECNLAPLCRRHHQAKQADGWHLDQPEPGVLKWTLPHGRTYTVWPDPYPV